MAVTINGTTGITNPNGSAASPAIQGEDTNTGLFFPAVDTVAVTTAGSERLRVDASGRLGIGTTSPTQKVHVIGGNILVNSASETTIITTGANFTTGALADSAIMYQSGNLLFGTGSTERMRIDTAGRVLTPGRPAFRAHTFTPISGAAGTIIWTVAAHNVGSHYNTSTGLFTAPVTGVYQFDFNILMAANSATNYIRVLFLVNGSNDTRLSDSLTGGSAGAFTNYTYHAISLSQSFYLAANDTVGVRNDNTGGSTYTTGGYGSFSGYLVG